MFAQIFTGCKCGETWHVEIVEDIDTERDEIYEYPVCTKCNQPVHPNMIDGHPCYHALTEEEAYWESYNPSDDYE